jgi:hypothetical protein
VGGRALDVRGEHPCRHVSDGFFARAHLPLERES